ncbi:MAG TPA: STAS domain-containing protein [Planctomycetota bacterium]|nr:STAS domain-containing protein [Planctomycetota bacterium]
MTRDDIFVDLALKSRMLSAAQVDDCRKLQTMLEQNGFTLGLREIISKKDLLTTDQLRVLNMALRYEEQKADDVAFGHFIQKKGFLTVEQLNDLLASQEQPYREGRHFPRLEDLILQKGYLTPQQIHVLIRAREQLEARPAVPGADPGSSPRVPRIQPAIPPPEPEPVVKPPSPADVRALEEGLRMANLSVSYRKVKLREGTGAGVVHQLDLQGLLDAITSKKLDAYLSDLIAAGGTRIVVDCERLEYISSAGIGVLMGSVRKCRDAQGDLRLAAVPEKIRKILSLVGLTSLLRIYDAQKGAVMSFKYG